MVVGRDDDDTVVCSVGHDSTPKPVPPDRGNDVINVVMELPPPIRAAIRCGTKRHQGGWRMARLDGKVAIVTGGSRGVGAATARAFVDEGAKVVIADIADERNEKLAVELGDNA